MIHVRYERGLEVLTLKSGSYAVSRLIFSFLKGSALKAVDLKFILLQYELCIDLKYAFVVVISKVAIVCQMLTLLTVYEL